MPFTDTLLLYAQQCARHHPEHRYAFRELRDDANDGTPDEHDGGFDVLACKDGDQSETAENVAGCRFLSDDDLHFDYLGPPLSTTVYRDNAPFAVADHDASLTLHNVSSPA